MKHFEINAEMRTDVGKKASKKIRRENSIPCVIYGGENNIHFFTPQTEVRKFVYSPEVMFADIKVAGKTFTTMVKDIQFHPVSDKILHIDFYEIHPDKPVKIQVPIKVTGSSPGVKSGGKLKQNFKRLTVRGLMNDIPDTFEISISNLRVNQTIKIKDLVSDKLEFIDPKANIVLTVTSTRGVALIEEEVEEVEAPESTEAAE